MVSLRLFVHMTLQIGLEETTRGGKGNQNRCEEQKALVAVKINGNTCRSPDSGSCC